MIQFFSVMTHDLGFFNFEQVSWRLTLSKEQLMIFQVVERKFVCSEHLNVGLHK